MMDQGLPVEGDIECAPEDSERGQSPVRTEEELAQIHKRNSWIRSADAALSDMRQRSYDGKLTTSSRWKKLAFQPAGTDAAEFEEALLTYIEQHDHAEDSPAMGKMEVPPSLEEILKRQDVSEDDPLPDLDVSDVVLIYGKKAIYLYSKPLMSHSFAHALFQTTEADDFSTFIDVIRAESRDYPRPVSASIFMNPPYLWSVDKTVGLFERTINNDAFDDIQITKTSEGESFFYSDKYLSEAQGKALAEWYGVQKRMNP